MRKLLLFLLLLMSVVGVYAQDNDHNFNPLIIEHDGIERRAHVYEPDGDINAVMIALHSFYSSPRALEAVSGLNTVADQRGWVIVYPESLQPYWDDGRSDVALPPDYGAVDDVGYLAQLSDTVRETYSVDKVYLTGLAVGGTMAIRAVCETPEKYDGVAIVSALMWTYQQAYCDASDNPATMDMIFIKGSDDHIYWTFGRELSDPNWSIMSAEATVTLWGERNGCASFANTAISNSTLVTSQNCTSDRTIAYFPIEKGSNNWMSMGDNILNRTGIDTAQLIAAFLSGDEDWQELTVQEAIPEAEPRSYTLYVPSTYDPNTPTPVVLSLHGRGANNFSQAGSTGFNVVAEEHGFIVVYPQAYDPNFDDPARADAVWNYNLGTTLYADTWNDDEYLDAIVDDLSQVLNVDMNRLYVNGLSNGGYMTHRLACTRGDRYAAFAAVAANAPYGISSLCSEGTHAPIMLYHGRADNISPWDGAPVAHPVTQQRIYLLAPIPNTLAFWLEENACGDGYEQTDIAGNDPDSRVIYIQYTDCPADSAVEMYAVVGGGHVWHGVQDFESELLGEVNMDVNASEAIWAFYSRFTLDGRDSSNEVEFDIGEATLRSTGMPDIPRTVNEVPQEEVSPEQQIIALLQAGGFTIFVAMDLSAPFDCDIESLSEEQLAQIDNNIIAFQQMEISIAEVVALDDCRAILAGEHYLGDGTSPATYGAGELRSTMATPAEPGGIKIIIGSSEHISIIVERNIEDSQSLLVQAANGAYTVLAIAPADFWTSLAEFYQPESE